MNNLYGLFVTNWFSAKGRSSRKEFNCRFVMMLAIFCIGIFYFNITGRYTNNTESVVVISLALILSYLWVIIGVLAVIQVFFVTHRRLHDLGYSGWWQLITLLPLGQILMIGFVFVKGVECKNKYGDPPEF